MQIPEDLVSALKARRLVVSVGSGFTRVAGLPSWSELLELVCGDLGISIPAVGSVSHNDLDKVQFRIVEQGTKPEVCRSLRKHLLGQPPTSDMKMRLNALFALDLAAVITWNWDDQLDSFCEVLKDSVIADGLSRCRRANTNPSVHLPPSTQTPPALQRDRLPLFKLQGRLEDIDSVVVSAVDYANVAADRNAFLEKLYTSPEFVVLHLGHAIDSGGVVGPIRSRNAGTQRHFALVPDATKEQAEAAVAEQGVAIITYASSTGHTESICAMLRALRERAER